VEQDEIDTERLPRVETLTCLTCDTPTASAMDVRCLSCTVIEAGLAEYLKSPIGRQLVRALLAAYAD
jgi:hypothetical protein